MNKSIKEYQTFFPKKDLYGNYTYEQIESYRTAIIFIHAEIEQCLEDICSIVIDDSFIEYNKSGKLNIYLFKFLLIKEAQHEEKKLGAPIDYIRSQIQFYKDTEISKNHKITIEGQAAIFKSLGLEKKIRDTSIVGINYEASCKMISKIRGEFAHHSRNNINITTDSKIVVDHIKNIKLGIKKIINVI